MGARAHTHRKKWQHLVARLFLRSFVLVACVCLNLTQTHTHAGCPSAADVQFPRENNHHVWQVRVTSHAHNCFNCLQTHTQVATGGQHSQQVDANSLFAPIRERSSLELSLSLLFCLVVVRFSYLSRRTFQAAAAAALLSDCAIGRQAHHHRCRRQSANT